MDNFHFEFPNFVLPGLLELPTYEEPPPLMEAVQAGNLAGVEQELRLLLASDGGNNINAIQDGEGWTALHLACNSSDRLPIVRFLIANGANLGAKDDSGKTPLHVACHRNQLETAKLLIQGGAEVNAEDENGQTPFDTIQFEYDWEMAKLMIEHGARFDKRDEKYFGRTRFHSACELGHFELAALLFQSGADVHAKDKNGLTPLHLACNHCGMEAPPNWSNTLDHLKLAKLLIESSDADINVTRNNGATPLHDACKNGNLEVIQLLLSLGANVQGITAEGLTPLDIACQENNPDAVNLLVRYQPPCLVFDEESM